VTFSTEIGGVACALAVTKADAVAKTLNLANFIEFSSLTSYPLYKLQTPQIASF
jgi:hypothetical protein